MREEVAAGAGWDGGGREGRREGEREREREGREIEHRERERDQSPGRIFLAKFGFESVPPGFGVPHMRHVLFRAQL
jgi:hypothetical protein